MSRHILKPLPSVATGEKAPTVAIGWDPPLATFFAIVHRESDNADEDDAIILWIGTSYAEIDAVETVIDAVAAYAAVPETLKPTLAADHAREGSRPRSPWIV